MHNIWLAGQMQPAITEFVTCKGVQEVNLIVVIPLNKCIVKVFFLAHSKFSRSSMVESCAGMA